MNCTWQRKLLSFNAMASAAILLVSAACADGNPEKGAAVFDQQCGVCHSLEKGYNKVGPSLYGLVGRSAGSIPDFAYSDALRTSAVIWTTEQLDKYIANPKATIPGVKMPYPGLADERARMDLITFFSMPR